MQRSLFHKYLNHRAPSYIKEILAAMCLNKREQFLIEKILISCVARETKEELRSRIIRLKLTISYRIVFNVILLRDHYPADLRKCQTGRKLIRFSPRSTVLYSQVESENFFFQIFKFLLLNQLAIIRIIER